MSLRTSFARTAAPLSCSIRRIASVMPLRAKIALPAWSSGSRMYSTPKHDLLAAEPSDEPDDVIFTNNFGVRSVELNRPKKLNSLNGSMARKILPRLQEWSRSELAHVIIMKGVGRAFCAGGDVVALAKQNQEGEQGQQDSCDYFLLEYQLDHFIATHDKPCVAFMDGITMGGGVGLSIHAPFRIATENTIFAMPETTIGFFPDVGASFFLPRMEGAMGTYLALTSEQLKGVDAFYHGVATHFIHSSSLQNLESRLAELQFPDTMPRGKRLEIIDATIEEFSTGLPATKPFISGPLRKTIDKVFHHDQPSIQAVLDSLAQVESDPSTPGKIKSWAKKTTETLHTRSPIAVAVTFQQMKAGREWSISETFKKEHQIASKFMAHPDFVEGVTQRLVNRSKERPNWSPNTLKDVTQNDVSSFFTMFGRPAELLSELDFHEYPHQSITGLPREDEILAVAAGKSYNETVKVLLEKYNGKQGLREKVGEVMKRFE